MYPAGELAVLRQLLLMGAHVERYIISCYALYQYDIVDCVARWLVSLTSKPHGLEYHLGHSYSMCTLWQQMFVVDS